MRIFGRNGKPAEIIDLDRQRAMRSHQVTRIDRPDGIAPLDLPQVTIQPVQADARLVVTQAVGELAERGCLDAGTPYVLDAWIDAQLRQWKTQLPPQVESRRRIAARLYAADIENCVRSQQELRQVRREATQKSAEEAYWRDQLTRGDSDRRSFPTPDDAGVRAEPVESVPRGELATLLGDPDEARPDTGLRVVPEEADDRQPGAAADEADTSGRPAGPVGEGWVDAQAAHETRTNYVWRLSVRAVIIGIVAAGDLAVIKSTLDLALNLREFYSWLVAIGLTLGAITLAMAAGRLYRRSTATGRSSTAVQIVVASAWAILGIALFVMRWRSGTFQVTTVTFGGAAPPQADQEKQEHLLALLLAGVYLATGVIAWLDGHHLTNDAAAGLRAARSQAANVAKRQAALEGLVARLTEHTEIHRHELVQVDAGAEQAVAELEALALELKAFARYQIAVHLGDPAATGVVRMDPVPSDADGAPPSTVGAVGGSQSGPSLGRERGVADR
ncbi:hypothetical protein [Kribbella sp. VKM Ac-2566]|uniref:hypothetical protein n=1 Tax=Kribbella sp. VKM Ac-2566 TaxID=2512218 RepID=UPI001063D756|nr:hypothetical protein [Kribbella sp. VKM Ac-2566]TDX03235.1 hypothetical protein EV647_1468 [Kribbella sp. VKM Ac-2566]